MKKSKKSAEYYWKGGDSNNPYEQKKREADNNIRKQHFDSVKRPEYVISELLQNADDAYAKKVTIKIDKTTSIPIFTFEHDGRDFDESDFEAICRFSCSNKKNPSRQRVAVELVSSQRLVLTVSSICKQKVYVYVSRNRNLRFLTGLHHYKQ